MSISTNGTVVARFAGALYNQQLSNATYTEVVTWSNTNDLNALLNAVYQRDFSNATDAAVANIIIANLGLAAVPGLGNWLAAQLTAAGANKGAKIAELLNGFAQTPATDPVYGAAAAAWNNQVANSQTLSQTTGNAGGEFTTLGTTPAGVTFTLTAGVDNIVGTAGNDTIRAFVGQDNVNNDASNLTALDTIDGGAGIDTLDLTVNYDYTIDAKISNVEIISARILEGSSASIDFANITGVTTVEIKDTNSDWGNVEGWNVSDAISTYKFTNVARQTDSVSMTMEFNNDVFTGSADAINVVLDKAGNSTNDEDAQLYLYAGGYQAVIEVMNVESKGSDNQFYYDDAGWWGTDSVLNTVNVTGTAALNLDVDNQEALATVNAAAFDGGLSFEGWSDVNMTVTTGAGKDVIDLQWSSMDNSISTAAGNDTITIGSGKDTVTAGTGDDVVKTMGNLATGDLLDGGDGIDKLGMTTAAAVTASLLTGTASTAYQALFSNFEVLAIGGSLGGDINLAKFDAMQSLKLADGASGFTVTGLSTGASIESNAGHAGDLTVTMTGAILGTADVLNLKLNATASADFAAINAADVETVNINSTTTNTTPSGVANTLDLLAAAHTTLTVTGNAKLDLSGAALTSVTTVAGAGFNAGLTVSLAGNANNTTVTLGNGANNVTGGDGKDTITTGSKADIIAGGAGNDTISAGDGTDSITGGLGLDTLTGGAGVDAFVYTAAAESQGVTVDVITDFTVGATGDKIDLSAVNSAGVFAGTASGYGAVLTTLVAGTANAVFDSSTSTLYFDVDANGALTTADLAIQLTGVTTGLVAANFDFVV